MQDAKKLKKYCHTQLLLISGADLWPPMRLTLKLGGTNRADPKDTFTGLEIIKVKPQNLLLSIKTDRIMQNSLKNGSVETMTILQQ